VIWVDNLENLINTGTVFTREIDGGEFVTEYIRGTRQAVWGDRVLYDADDAEGAEPPDEFDEGIAGDVGDGVANGMAGIGDELLDEIVPCEFHYRNAV
jgi:hypothetical protein